MMAMPEDDCCTHDFIGQRPGSRSDCPIFFSIFQARRLSPRPWYSLKVRFELGTRESDEIGHEKSFRGACVGRPSSNTGVFAILVADQGSEPSRISAGN